ncbi:hypothetical protein ATANTOWER_004861 [Ataeniobius toweri]|uniref:Uncharacterized protein n=1 Tax=Ataeniobius toweri TaxID=208326 RepID=A0ABU7C0J5_9TELE|nr:hypothetical protein [Ataeniobius toweri]
MYNCHNGRYRSYPFAAITASTLLRRLSTSFRSVSLGIFYHSFRSTFLRSHTDVGQEGLAHSFWYNLSQMCSMDLRSGLCAVQSCSRVSSTGIKVPSPTP